MGSVGYAFPPLPAYFALWFSRILALLTIESWRGTRNAREHNIIRSSGHERVYKSILLLRVHSVLYIVYMLWTGEWFKGGRDDK